MGDKARSALTGVWGQGLWHYYIYYCYYDHYYYYVYSYYYYYYYAKGCSS